MLTPQPSSRNAIYNSVQQRKNAIGVKITPKQSWYGPIQISYDHMSRHNQKGKHCYYCYVCGIMIRWISIEVLYLSLFELYLSAIPPDTMVVAVVAKDNWNKNFVKTGPISKPSAFTNLCFKAFTHITS